MTDKLEQRLQHARPAAPSAGLDRRIETEFTAARHRKTASRRTTFWWWTAMMAAVGGAAALVVVASHRTLPVPEVAVYHIAAEGRLREMLLNPAPPREITPRFVVHVSTP